MFIICLRTFGSMTMNLRPPNKYTQEVEQESEEAERHLPGPERHWHLLSLRLQQLGQWPQGPWWHPPPHSPGLSPPSSSIWWKKILWEVFILLGLRRRASRILHVGPSVHLVNLSVSMSVSSFSHTHLYTKLVMTAQTFFWQLVTSFDIFWQLLSSSGPNVKHKVKTRPWGRVCNGLERQGMPGECQVKFRWSSGECQVKFRWSLKSPNQGKGR